MKCSVDLQKEIKDQNFFYRRNKNLSEMYNFLFEKQTVSSENLGPL